MNLPYSFIQIIQYMLYIVLSYVVITHYVLLFIAIMYISYCNLISLSVMC